MRNTTKGFNVLALTICVVLVLLGIGFYYCYYGNTDKSIQLKSEIKKTFGLEMFSPDSTDVEEKTDTSVYNPAYCYPGPENLPGLPKTSPSGKWCRLKDVVHCASPAPACMGIYGDRFDSKTSSVIYDCNSEDGCVKIK